VSQTVPACTVTESTAIFNSHRQSTAEWGTINVLWESLRYDTIRCGSEYLMCAEKLTDSQLNLADGIKNRKNRKI